MRILLAACCVALMLISACSDDDGVGPQDSFSIDQFPIAVGDWWRYEVVDTNFSVTGYLDHTVDTVFVQAAETLYVDCIGADCPGVFVRFVFDDGDYQWDVIVAAKVDTLTLDAAIFVDLADNAAPWPAIRWHFPLEVGKQWQGALGDVTVVDREQVTLPPAFRVESYLLHQDWDGFNAGGHTDVWVAPEIGIARQRSSNFCTVCGVWRISSNWSLIDWFGRYRPID
jgi:hypothetical protein